jgi:signal transduction histidine kinase
VSYYILNYTLCGAGLLLSIIGLWFSVIIPGINQWSKRFFLSYFLVFLLCCLSGFIEMVIQSYHVPGVIFYFLLLLEGLLLSLPLPMLTVFLLHCSNESMRSSKLLHAVLCLWGILLIVLASAMFIDGFIYVTAGNRYYRGSLYPLFLLPAIALLMLNLVGVIKRRKRLSRKVCHAFFIAILPIIVTLSVNLFVDFFPLIDISYVISALAMYSFILTDQIEQDRRNQREIAEQQRKIAEQQRKNAEQQRKIAEQQQENAEQQRKIANQQREIANQRASVMVLQMRPHFIYNTLMSIYSLCKRDPQKARQITKDFTNYLRKNFNAVASDSTIPFSTELEHTRAYLAVEQAQYDDMLVVDYDTPFTHFRLPPLTLQPIAENAVKHGMDPYRGPLHISIRTRNTDSGTEITVEDDGPGFDPSDESRPHTALENIRQRLEMMCAGKLDVISHPEGGTTVIVTIRGQKEER